MSSVLTSTSDQPRRSSRRVFQALWPYLWPHDWRKRGIILFAFLTLAASRLFALVAPFFYKESVDGLTPSIISGVAALPLGFILAYGAARMATQLTNYSRNLIFEPFLLSVADDIRLRFFAHLHSLSLRFHLERQTGALTMALERGVNGMRYVIENMVFNIIPTVIELILVSALLAKLYNFSYAGIILVTVLIYGGVTHRLTEKRDTLLRSFLGARDRTNTVTMDSLLNYETVKYYVKERYEASRLRESRLSLRSALLNI
jgi:ATP-binding cassette subfamily B protein